MKRFALPVLVLAAVPVFAGCSDDQPQYESYCRDSVTLQIIDWDYCNEGRGSAQLWLVPYGSTSRHYLVGERVTAGVSQLPKSQRNSARVYYPDAFKPKSNKIKPLGKPIDIYTDKQAGSTTKLNQDAKKVSTVTGEKARDRATKQRFSFGSTTKTRR